MIAESRESGKVTACANRVSSRLHPPSRSSGARPMAASDYEAFDERFRNCVNRTSHVQQLWTGARWTEGPVHFPLGRYVLFSDIPNDRIMRYDETDGSVSVFRAPCGYSNGHTVD